MFTLFSVEHLEVPNDTGCATVNPNLPVCLTRFWSCIGVEPLEIIQQPILDIRCFDFFH
jgi:hypothetical protein